MGKPIEYPAWRYHQDHEPVMVKSDEDYHKLPGDKKEWHDNLVDAKIAVEVYDQQGVQKIRRIPGWKPEKVIKKSDDEIAAEELSKDQGQGEQSPEEDLSKASDERLREVLIGHGYEASKLEKLSRKQLLKKFSE